MKYSLAFAVTLISIVSCRVQSKVAAPVAETRTYEVSSDPESKILKGYINRSLVESDTSFKWFKENMKWGTADAAAVQALQASQQLHFVVFGGTWCHDTQSLLPVFYRLADKAAITNEQITLIGVDRAKTALNGFHKVFNVTNVPTFIVMKNGKEVGRVVEYGKYGAIDKEIGEIVAASNASK